MTRVEKKRLLRCIGATCLLAAAAAGALAIMKSRGGLISCPIRALTGFYCPGCGNTRAFAALVRLRFAESLTYNYAYPVEFLYLLIVYIGAAKNYVRRGKVAYHPRFPALEYVLLALLLVWGVVRNILGV
ncbi:MAG: DUF2752 domain-containing protein [Clostridia bacterium]|nr:DUF2752 domain-containing protein [Clostridia bacterium]